MKFEIELAEAFKVEAGKQYLVIFESNREPSATDVEDIKTQITKLFDEFGAKVKPVVIMDGNIKIGEIEQ
jgi:hypothetical protein